MTTTSERPKRTTFAAALALVALCLLAPAAASAQWTTPDSNGNINSTNTGNVGVGNSAPKYKIDLAAPNTQLRFGSDTTDSGGYLISLGPSQASMVGGAAWNGTALVAKTTASSTFSASSGALNFYADTGLTAGSTFTPTLRMTIDTSGNVGVGTAAPNYKVEVSGSASRNTLALTGDGDSVGYAGIKIQALTTTGIATNRTSSFNLHMRKDSWYGGDGSGPSFIIETGSKTGGYAAPFLITPTNDVILNGGRGASGLSYGSVGVGTTTPAYKLDVAGQVRSSSGGFVFPDGSTQTTASVGTVTGVTAGSGLAGGGSGGSLTLNVAAGAGITAGAGGVSVNYGSTAGTAVQGNTTLTVTAGTGMSGGGTTTLGSGGTITLNNSDAGSAQNIFKNVANAAGAAQFSAGSNNDAIRFEGTGGTSVSFDAATKKVTINSSSASSSGWTDGGSSVSLTNTSASVGVGTASPASPLDVQTPVTAATANGVRLQQTLSAGANNGSLNGLYINPTFNDGVAVGNAHNALVTVGGNVGIGTAATGAGLDVQNAGVPVGGASYGARFQQAIPSSGNNSNSTAVLINPTFNDGVAVGVSHNGLVVASGNVGVGTTSPGYKLDVAGSVNASGLCLGGDCKSAWSQVGGGTSQWANGTSGAIFYSTGVVGIGTASPSQSLTVSGYTSNTYGNTMQVVGTAPSGSAQNQLNITPAANAWGLILGANNAGVSPSAYHCANCAHVVNFNNAPLIFGTNNTERVRVDGSGNVGIGTASPTNSLEVTRAVAGNYNGLYVYNSSGAPYNSSDSVSLSLGRSSGNVMAQLTASNKANGTFGDGYLAFSTRRADQVAERMRIDENGNVGVGTPGPAAKLDVNANSDTAVAIHATGAINASGAITGATVNATYQDVAEWVPSTQKLAAGTVVVLDTDHTNQVLASSKSYDTKVAGVVSSQPGVILGQGGEGRLKVATTGRVKVKVDATRSPIKVGDLLVTSDEEGVAMKSIPVDLGGTQIHRPGTIIGKALEPLASGTGEILVLLSLQ